jgi:hypothetical protein
MKKIIAGLALILVLGGCSAWNDAHGKGDAPVGRQDDSPAYVINMPDGFMNFAFKCNGKDGLYAHTRDAAPVVIPNDPNCTAGG